MKKIFITLMMAFAVLATQSCKENGLSLVYDLTVVGDADGNVRVTFPNGNFGVDGKAGLSFVYSNDTTAVKSATSYKCDYGLAEGLASKDAKVKDAAEKVEKDLVSVTSANGTYYVHVTGYAKETVTGLVFAIDKEFTNREKTFELPTLTELPATATPAQ